MTQIINLIKLVLSLIPAIVSAIQGIEAAFPQSGQGVTKLDIIKTTLQNTYTVVDNTMPAFEDLWTKLSAVVSGIVSVFNAAGIFKKG
jgi:hypothetical protein